MNWGAVDVLSTRRAWLIWLLMVAFSVAVYSFTLNLTKVVWQDEVKIVEYGRVVFPGADLTHSIAWNAEGNYPKRGIYYLGPAMQEAFYRLFRPGPTGVRISSILGAVFASAALFGWLASRGFVRWIALACSLLMFWDPLFVESYRGARVDSWAMAFMLLAFWVISEGRKRPVSRTGFASWQVTAGLSVAVAGVTWISTILLVPLLVFESLRPLPGRHPDGLVLRVASLAWLGLFSVAFLTIFLLPVLPTILLMFGTSLGHAGEAAKDGFNLGEMILPYARSPWVPLLAIGLILALRLWGIGLVLALSIILVLITGSYVHRDIYLLPCYLLAIACGGSLLWKWGEPRKAVRRPLVAFALSFMLLWSFAVSVGARNARAWRQREFRDSTALLRMLKSHVPAGSHKTYLFPWELYYATRELGWKSYRILLGEKEPTDADVLEFLKDGDIDIVIKRAGKADPSFDDGMRNLGFTSKKVRATSAPKSIPEAFGEYMIYERPVSAPALPR